MKKILVVDDTKHLARGLSEVLEFEGFEARFAFDGLQAIAVMKTFVPDLVITDLRMPKMDGFQLIAAIRNDETLKRIPIIVITASVGPENRSKILDAGANLLVVKPFDEEKLIDIIKTLLDE